MRSTHLLSLIGLCILLAAARPSSPGASFKTKVITRHYDPKALTWTAAAKDVSVRWGDLPLVQRPGRPVLPVDRVTLVAPPGLRLVDVRIREEGSVRIPLPLPVVKGAGDVSGPWAAGDPDGEAHFSVTGGVLRGRRLDTVDLRPVRLREDGSLEAFSRVVLELVYGADAEPGLTPRPVAWEPRDPFADAVNRIASVPETRIEAPTSWHPQVNGEEPFSPRFLPSEEGSPVRYLIITNNQMAPAFQALADWRTSLGMPAAVRTVEWIRTNYPPGLDQAEEIRNFIARSVELWGVEYVLLGGDLEQVATRFAKSYNAGGENIPTDLYFSSLDGNWNANGDALFGEAYFDATHPGDGTDLYPDVWVGRAPTRTLAEAQTWVNKIKDYEREVPLGTGFGSRILVLGEMLFPQNWNPPQPVIFDGAAVCESALVHLDPPVTSYRLYENHLSYPGSVLETKSAVVGQINVGYNLVHHVGHGFRNTMAVGVGDLTLDNSDADGFTNGLRQGVLYAINCTSSAFDFDCIAEHLLRNPTGGILGSIGSTRLDYPATGWKYQNEFYRLVYDAGVTGTGEAAARQKLPFVPDAAVDGEDLWTQFSLIYMGDPALDLYTGEIDSMAVSVLEPFQLGQANYTVTVTDAHGAMPGAVVCLNKAGDAYGYAVTNGSGQATVPFRPDYPGPATLGVRAHNHRSKVVSVSVAPPPGPYLFVIETSVNDTVGGDGDGTLEAGESAGLTLTLGNQGGSVSGAVTVNVTAAPSGLTVTDATAASPSIPAGASRVCLDPLGLTVGTQVPDVSALEITVSLVAGSVSRSEPLVLYVGGPALALERSVVRDTTGNGNGNGVVEAGEDQHLRVVLANRGLGRSRNLSATLTSTDPAVTLLDGTSAYADLEPEQSGGGDGFRFRFNDASTSHLLRLVVSDQRGPVLVRSLDIRAPATPVGLAAIGSATSITLTWTPVVDADLAGYHLYRAVLPSGPFARITPVRIPRISTYRDEDLPPLTRFYYRSAAIDSSGNEGPMSAVADGTTSLASESGFPVDVFALTPSSPCIGELAGGSPPEIVSGGSEVFALHADGEEVLDGDQDARTLGPFTGEASGPYWMPPAVADIDKDGFPDVVAAGFTTGQLYVWDHLGQVKPGWPQNLNISNNPTPSLWGAPALADLDGDGTLEIVINAANRTFAFHPDGTEVADGDGNPATRGVLIVMGSAYNYSTPALADLDNDGHREVIVGSRDGKLYVVRANGTALPGFPFNTGGEITSSPAVGDLNGDGLKEIVFASSNSGVYAINKNLVQPPGWPQIANMSLDLDSSPALADLDRDGHFDVALCAGNGRVFVWHGQNGQLFPGFGFQILSAAGAPVPISSSPSVGNIDADTDWEICFGGNDGRLYAYNINGTPVAGFPIQTTNRIEGGPLLWDVDNDGLTEVVAHSTDQKLYMWHSPGVFFPNFQPWPMFHRTSARTGEVDPALVGVPTGVPEGDGGAPRPLLGPAVPNPFGARTMVEFRVPETPTGEGDVDVSVFDLSGRRVRVLVSGPVPSGAHTAVWDGRDDAGHRLGAGVYFLRLRVPGENPHARKLMLLP